MGPATIVWVSLNYAVTYKNIVHPDQSWDFSEHGPDMTHHSEIQWASSITASETTVPLVKEDMNSLLKNLSGETKRTWSKSIK